jgi:hypothetical protein
LAGLDEERKSRCWMGETGEVVEVSDIFTRSLVR